MSAEIKKTLAAAGVFVSMMVGAGFATGRELLTFFAASGLRGAVGFAVACAVLIICGWAVMDIAQRKKISGYRDFMGIILGKRLGGAMVALVNVFIFVMLSTMLAGAGAAAQMTSPLPLPAGAFIMAALCFVVFLFDLRGIVSISTVLAPILVIGGIFFGIHAALTATVPTFLTILTIRAESISFLRPAVIYASYNLLTSVAVLCVLGAKIGSPRAARRAAFIAGGIIFALGLSFLAPIYLNFPALQGIPVPLLAIAEHSGAALHIIYVLILFAAILTTAVSCGFAVITYLTTIFPRRPLLIKAAVTLSAAALSQLGFATFIDIAYPLFGYIGLFQIAAILVYFLSARFQKLP